LASVGKAGRFFNGLAASGERFLLKTPLGFSIVGSVGVVLLVSDEVV